MSELVKETVDIQVESDSIAPKFLTGPQVQNIDVTGLTLFMKLDEAGTIFYSVHKDGEAPPLPMELTGNGISVETVSDTNNVTIEVTGLLAGTDYDIYLIAQDREGNLQDNISLVKIKTLE